MPHLPFAFVDISVGGDVPAIAVGLILEPVPLVVGPVPPDLPAPAGPQIVLPLALVGHPVVEIHGFFGRSAVLALAVLEGLELGQPLPRDVIEVVW